MAATLQRRLRVLRRRGRRASCARQRGIEGTDSESESPRRSLLCAFTCDKCGERSVRRVNPLAYERGTVFVQCQHEPCGAWHQLKDNLHLIDEVRFFDEDNEEKKSTDGG